MRTTNYLRQTTHDKPLTTNHSRQTTHDKPLTQSRCDRQLNYSETTHETTQLDI